MNFRRLYEAFKSKHILVVGDLMLDEYIVGRAMRISPEAPVMVIKQQRIFAVPGGAANVAKNVEAMGGKASVIGVVGEDGPGIELQEALGENGFVVPDSSRPTTRKTRVLADTAHQVLRIDQESDKPIDDAVALAALSAVSERIGACDAVLLSDYTKGVLTKDLVQRVIEMASSAAIPIIANAKPESLENFSGATLVSLNSREASEAIGVKDVVRGENGKGLTDFPREAAKKIADDYNLQHVLITLGEYGMCTEAFYVNPQKVEVFDTAGAGDTTIATVALGMAVAGFDPIVFQLASHTAAAVVGHVGVAVPSRDDIDRILGRSID